MLTKASLARVFIGLAVYIACAFPLFALGLLSRDVRIGLFSKYMQGAAFPTIPSLLLPFSPIDGWSYITPIALAVAAGCAVSKSVRLTTAVLIFSGAVIQLFMFTAAFIPYKKLTNIMGYPEPGPYPTMQLVINVIMVVGTMILAVLSVKRLIALAKD